MPWLLHKYRGRLIRGRMSLPQMASRCFRCMAEEKEARKRGPRANTLVCTSPDPASSGYSITAHLGNTPGIIHVVL